MPGALVCIVGRVGTGKSALLAGLINEMKQVSGRTTFGGTVSYGEQTTLAPSHIVLINVVPQKAWVQSGTIIDNITFGTPDNTVDMARVAEVIRACGLESDLELWPDREQYVIVIKRPTSKVELICSTYIGEKGITLSGGQRQRICVARAAYAHSDIVLLDDPLSALDAKVGHHLLQHCTLNGPLSAKTRLLVTHHLDVLSRADWIIVMDSENNEGRIVQQGSYRVSRIARFTDLDHGLTQQDLVARPGLFRKLMADFGSTSRDREEETMERQRPSTSKAKEDEAKDNLLAKSEVKLMLDEERETGEVKWAVYDKYIRAMGSGWWAVVIAASLLLEQGATVGNSLLLGFWSGGSIEGFAQGEYMAAYAGEPVSWPSPMTAAESLTMGGLGLAVAVFTVSIELFLLNVRELT